MELFNIKHSERSLKIRCDHLVFLKEIEIGYEREMREMSETCEREERDERERVR